MVHLRRKVTLAAVAVLCVLAACSAESGLTDTQATSTSFDRTTQRPIVTIGVTGWASARLNVAVAETLIERRLGYPVETVEILDFPTMFQDLEQGDELHAVLEVWPNALEDRERAYLEQNRVTTLGELGVTGRIGWYMPAAAAIELGVETWVDLADPVVVAALSDAQTSSAADGGDDDESAAAGGPATGRFLGINPSYAQHDQELMAELDLPYQVSFSGSESATRDSVRAAVAADEPILVYWWTPTELAVEADLVEVDLPPWTEQCQADRDAGRAAGCGYRPERLLKVSAPGLADVAPEVELFLRAFTLTNADQDFLLALLVDGQSISQAADRWIAENAGTWEPWVEDLG